MGQSCSLLSCPFHVKPKLLFSDVKVDRCVLGQSHTENIWLIDTPALLDQSMANGIRQTIPQFPKRLQDPTGMETG
jgi:hypothetical protein